MNTKLLTFVALTFISSITMAQKSTQHPRVRVKNWGKTTLVISDVFWTMAKDQLLEQVGPDAFENLKTFSKQENLPKQMQLMQSPLTMNDPKALYQRLDSLKVFKQSSVKLMSNENLTEYIIVSIPYSDNTAWDKEAKWDTVYYLIKSIYVDELK